MRKPSPATLIAALALFVALGGPAAAAKLISGKKLKDNSVTSAKIRNRTLTSDDLSRPTLRSLKRTGSNVTSANIVDGTIQLADMSANNVTGNQVADRSLTGVDFAADSITAAEIATGAIGAPELAADSVLNKTLKDGAVTKTKLSKDAVAESEVRDGSLTGKDIGVASDTLTASTIGAVSANGCETQDFDLAGPDLAGALLVVGAPVDGVVASARAIDAAADQDTTADDVRLQVCAPAAVPDANGAYPFIAFAP
jgi:hypothetical protein